MSEESINTLKNKDFEQEANTTLIDQIPEIDFNFVTEAKKPEIDPIIEKEKEVKDKVVKSLQIAHEIATNSAYSNKGHEVSEISIALLAIKIFDEL